MSLPRRARGVRAQRESVPAFDALRMLQPEVYSDVLQSVLESYEAVPAKLGQRTFDTLRNTDGPAMGMAKALRREFKVWPTRMANTYGRRWVWPTRMADAAASLPQDAATLSQPSSTRVAKALSARSAFAFKWQRVYIELGA